MNKKVGFIGCGNMGSALIRAAVAAAGPEGILISDADRKKTKALAGETGVRIENTEILAKEAGMIFLGVKPQQLDGLLAEIRPVLESRRDRFVLVSMAAGVTIDRLQKTVGKWPVIRIMPNLAAAVGEGVILYAEKDASGADMETFVGIMKRAGELCALDEKLMDAGMALTGCGPAFVYMFIEALADAAVSLGIPRSHAYRLASQTVLGSAKLQLTSGKPPAELKDAVCSPGGTTIEGVLSLEKNGFRAAVSEAVLESYKKTKSI